jgi:hypothetical protein
MKYYEVSDYKTAPIRKTKSLDVSQRNYAALLPLFQKLGVNLSPPVVRKLMAGEHETTMDTLRQLFVALHHRKTRPDSARSSLP